MTRYVKVYDDELFVDETYQSDGTPAQNTQLAAKVAAYLNSLPKTSNDPA